MGNSEIASEVVELTKIHTTADIVRGFRERNQLHVLKNAIVYMPKHHRECFEECLGGYVPHERMVLEPIYDELKDITNEGSGD